ncbi:ABC transporter substrate-binding protein [Parasulfitobacter algicola]|uniref:Carbohydrate ABC transporter substrate-binding protein n=1 Tax=Parasulfitobacter algicola TaxID=2614809 RepID=A0ABX2IYW7_9RHOB|nr:ABC transporter substrate-binding protein [Sulfitobacter algicola]NSX55478.1 carbohydrate ABC transporter substrate-binding protein [Sulfitobacter algicola]
MKHLLCSGAVICAFGLSASQAVADLPFDIGYGDFNWDSYTAFADQYDLSGQIVTVTGPWTGADNDLVTQVLSYFEEATGATVNYSGSESFENDIVISARANSAPNVAVFPQPGLASDLAGQGLVAPLDDATADWLTENYAAGDSWVDLATFANESGEDQLFGFFYKVDLKSLVWYSPEQFDEAGYDIPQTMEELKELTDLIVEDGATPWCIGLDSGAAKGWPATDWVEDMMLRTQPPEVYDQWVSNEIPFDDPRVVAAIEEFGYFARNDDYVDGDASSIVTIDFRDSAGGLFTLPPKCYMHRQASFIPTFFPDGTEMGVDVDFFYFPSYAEQDLGNPVLGAGTMWSITNDSEGARALIEYLKTPIAHETWMALSGFLTPHKGVNTELYSNDTNRALGDVLLNATTFRFDGSDLMPGEIGSGAFWKAMIDYSSGSDAATVAGEVQQRWNSIQ